MLAIMPLKAENEQQRCYCSFVSKCQFIQTRNTCSAVRTHQGKIWKSWKFVNKWKHSAIILSLHQCQSRYRRASEDFFKWAHSIWIIQNTTFRRTSIVIAIGKEVKSLSPPKRKNLTKIRCEKWTNHIAQLRTTGQPMPINNNRFQLFVEVRLLRRYIRSFFRQYKVSFFTILRILNVAKWAWRKLNALLLEFQNVFRYASAATHFNDSKCQKSHA